MKDRGSVTVAVPPVLLEKLDRLAKERGESRQVFIRRLIADECDKAARDVHVVSGETLYVDRARAKAANMGAVYGRKL